METTVIMTITEGVEIISIISPRTKYLEEAIVVSIVGTPLINILNIIRFRVLVLNITTIARSNTAVDPTHTIANTRERTAILSATTQIGDIITAIIIIIATSSILRGRRTDNFSSWGGEARAFLLVGRKTAKNMATMAMVEVVVRRMPIISGAKKGTALAMKVIVLARTRGEVKIAFHPYMKG